MQNTDRRGQMIAEVVQSPATQRQGQSRTGWCATGTRAVLCRKSPSARERARSHQRGPYRVTKHPTSFTLKQSVSELHENENKITTRLNNRYSERTRNI